MPPAHRLSRIQIYAQNNPRRYAAIAGTGAGAFFGAAMAAVPFLLFRESGWDAALIGLGTAAVAGAFFGTFMGVFVLRAIRRSGPPLPAGTDPARLAEARRLLRGGVPGADPETNRVAAQVAAKVAAAPWTPRLNAVVFSLGAALNAAMALLAFLDGEVGRGVLFGSGVLLFCLLLVVVLPVEARARRRAAAFRAAVDEDGRPRTGAGEH